MGYQDWSTIPDENAYADPAIPATDGTPAKHYMRAVRGVMAGIAGAFVGQTSRARRAVADTNATVLATDSYVGVSAITAPRTLNLPPASTFPVGQPLTIADETGLLSPTVSLTVDAAGADTIAGDPSFVMGSPYQKVVLHSNGSNLWTV